MRALGLLAGNGLGEEVGQEAGPVGLVEADGWLRLDIAMAPSR